MMTLDMPGAANEQDAICSPCGQHLSGPGGGIYPTSLGTADLSRLDWRTKDLNEPPACPRLIVAGKQLHQLDS